MNKSPRIEVRELEEPLEMELSVQGYEVPKVWIPMELKVAIAIIIPSSRLLVIVRNARVAVAEMKIHTVLLS